MTSFYTEEELSRIGLNSFGKNVKLSRHATIYSPHLISIGDNVRIDDFCILSGNITLGSHIHISPYVALYGAQGIELQDYSGISPCTTVFSAMDDFSGEYLIGPIHDESQTNVTGGKVTLERFTQVGTHCVVFPNLTISEGSVVGAMSLVTKSTMPWTINVGIPAKSIKERSKNLLKRI